MRHAVRAISTVLIVSGTLLLVDAGLTVAWQEPVSAVYAHLRQAGLDDDLRALERARLSAVERAALASLDGERRRLAFLARALKRAARRGDAVGRIRIARLGANFVVVDGSDTSSLRTGPGIYDRTPFPGAPGTVAIAGHRTTYGSPFRHIDDLDRGDDIVVEMPYGRFTYEVQRTRIVPPTEVSVVARTGYDRLVLSACHPLYSADKRIVVFARLVNAAPRGVALTAR